MRRFVACVLAVVAVSCGGAAEERGEATTPSADVADSADVAETPAAEPPSEGGAGWRMDAILAAHDARRAQHCAPPLVWSDAMAREAEAWAAHLASSGCQLEHSQSPYGENLAAGTEGTLSPENVVEMWYRESEGYRFARGGFSMSTGHFTQLVWTSSQRLGCGLAACGDLEIWVCNYDPPGNVEGQFRENVLPTSCQ